MSSDDLVNTASCAFHASWKRTVIAFGTMPWFIMPSSYADAHGSIRVRAGLPDSES
jgi:hypothetical protein